jgi:hypothetical protein
MTMRIGTKILLILPLALTGAMMLSLDAYAEALVPGDLAKKVTKPPEPYAVCSITGHIEGERNLENPELGDWKYTMTMAWDSGDRYALSHWNLFLDESHYHCSPDDILSAVWWEDNAASSTSEPDGCTTGYEVRLEAFGDPSIDLEGVILKFEPREGCEPGPTGEAVFVFYSNDSPAPILMPNAFLSDKAGRIICYGEVTGVFPGIPCDPTSSQMSSWGSLKGDYR